jgi:predicted O-linked N-acetylglucosamine transferase (SPINDLY family)
MIDPANAARAALAAGDPQNALRIAQANVAAQPSDVGAARLYAIVCSELGAVDGERAWRRVLALSDGDPEAHYMLGNAEGDRGDFAAAADHFRAALVRAPAHPQLRASLGLALEALGRIREAETCFRQALDGAREPHYALIANLARNLFLQRRYAEALHYFDALAKNFSVTDATQNAAHAACLSFIGRDDEAEAAFRRAIEQDPSAPGVPRDYAAFLMRRARHADAMRVLEQAQVESGKDLLATSMLLVCRLHLGDWRAIDALRALIVDRAANGLHSADDIVPAYDFLAICDDPLLQRTVAQSWARGEAPDIAPATSAQKRGRQKLRLGFVSSDYSNHPVGRLVVGLFEHLDRSRFQVTAYATSSGAADTFGARIKAAVDRYRTLDRRDPDASARTVAADACDVLFDLNGFSGGEAIRLFARRPAPMQMNFLGYAGTLGSSVYDFIVTDRYCVPPEHQDAFAEQLFYVDPCYLPSDPKRLLASPARNRADYSLPQGAFVFCASVAIYKILPEMFGRWIELLREVRGSVLWLRHLTSDRVERLRMSAERLGVDGARLIAAPGEGIDHYLARFALADLFLDSFPFGSHTTVNDALFAGLPAVTIAGASFAGRASASQLRTAGLAQLIARDFDDYTEIARSLAGDRTHLAEIRQMLVDTRARSPLFDMDAYARSFETALVNARETHASSPAR